MQPKLNEKVGVMFGRERTGLYNEEIVLSDCMIQIPVSKRNSSLNLAQAVAIICYEFSKMQGRNIKEKPTINSLACKEDLMYFFQFLENELLKSGFLRNEEMFLNMQQNIRNMFVRTGLTDQDLRTLHGIFRSFIK
jgi:tRNA/rRNA methyltransferase